MIEQNNILKNKSETITSFLDGLTSRVKGDKAIWGIVLFLTLSGMLLIYSSIGSLANKQDVSTGSYLIKQIFFILLGLVFIYLMHLVNYTFYSKIATALFVLATLLLIYTLFAGVQINSGTRWIRLPLVNLTFQPSDFAKLALYIYLSRVIAKKQKVIHEFKKGFLPLIIPVTIIFILILPSNLSTACLIVLTSLVIMIIGRVPFKFIGLVLLIGLIGIGTLAGMATLKHKNPQTFSYDNKSKIFIRVNTWISRFETFIYAKKEIANDKLFQNNQASIAVANGGWFGVGPGNSKQKNFLPHCYSDFIFAVIIEEYGMFGAALVVFLYLLFLYRCIKIFNKTPYAFGSLLAVSLSFSLVLQGFVHMMVNLNLLPNTGVTLPLISMGGTSLIFTSVSIGIILSVARNVNIMEGTEEQTTLILNESEKETE